MNTHRSFTLPHIWPVIAQFTSDIAERLDCSWAVAMLGPNFGLGPLYAFGRTPDLQECVAETKALVSGHLSVAAVMLDGSHAEKSTPRILCAVRVQGEIAAVLALGPTNAGTDYSSQDRQFVARHVENISFLLSDEQLAAKIGLDLARSRRTRHELESAREVQQRFFPRMLPTMSGLDCYGESQPIGEVGGDFFDFITARNSSLLLSIGDVSGKGIPSALVMAAVQGSLRALESHLDLDLCKLMHDLNCMIWQLAPDNFFATMFCARIDVGTGEMQYVNAGHERAVLVTADKSYPVTLDTTGSVLGFSSRAVFERRTIWLRPGDTLVAVTDGITEATDCEAGAFDIVVLDGMQHAGRSARDLAGHIMQTARQHSGESEIPADDQTVVVVRRTGELADVIRPVPIRPRVLAHAIGL